MDPTGTGAGGGGGLPVADWQFWVAALIALCAAGWLVRRLWRAAAPARRRRGKRVELTLEGKAISYGAGGNEESDRS